MTAHFAEDIIFKGNIIRQKHTQTIYYCQDCCFEIPLAYHKTTVAMLRFLSSLFLYGLNMVVPNRVFF